MFLTTEMSWTPKSTDMRGTSPYNMVKTRWGICFFVIPLAHQSDIIFAAKRCAEETFFYPSELIGPDLKKFVLADEKDLGPTTSILITVISHPREHYFWLKITSSPKRKSKSLFTNYQFNEHNQDMPTCEQSL